LKASNINKQNNASFHNVCFLAMLRMFLKILHHLLYIYFWLRYGIMAPCLWEKIKVTAGCQIIFCVLLALAHSWKKLVLINSKNENHTT